MSSNLGVIGNGAFGALIDRRARVVWCSLEGFGADPIFNSLLNNDSDESGWFDVSIENMARTEQKYVANSGVLITTLVSHNGDVLQVKDFAPRFYHHDRIFHQFQFIRVVTRVRGDPITTIRIRPSFEYNSADGYQTRGAHHIRYCGPNGTLRLTTNAPIQLLMDESAFMIHDPVYLVFGQDESISSPLSQLCKEYEDRTIKYWKNWCMNLAVPVDYQDVLIRAAITLQMMQSDEVGGIVGSLTLGIPLGPDLPPSKDERTFQLPELCISVPVLRQFGLMRMCRKFFEFLKSVCLQYDNPQAVYDYVGRNTCPAIELGSMAGYLGSGTLIAGGVVPDTSIVADVGMYGLLIIALSHGFYDQRFRDICSVKLFDRLEAFGEQCVAAFADLAANAPHRIAASIASSSYKFFEDDLMFLTLSGGRMSRGSVTVPTITSVLCWAAADRLARIAESSRWMEKSRIWSNHASMMRAEILQRAVKNNHFVSFWDSDTVGPSVLRLAELGFIDPTDSLFRETVSAFELEGLKSCLRWSSVSSPFLTSTLLWYAEALRSTCRESEARKIFHSLCAINNEVGLFAESVDLSAANYWGNFPHTGALLGFMRLGSRLSRDWSGV